MQGISIRKCSRSLFCLAECSDLTFLYPRIQGSGEVFCKSISNLVPIGQRPEAMQQRDYHSRLLQSLVNAITERLSIVKKEALLCSN